jgi:hypothetical protein
MLLKAENQPVTVKLSKTKKGSQLSNPSFAERKGHFSNLFVEDLLKINEFINLFL